MAYQPPYGYGGAQDPYANRDAMLAALAEHAPPKSAAQIAQEAAARGTPGFSDPAAAAKYSQIDFDKLGNRDYLNKQQGGAAWDSIYGQAPAGYVYNANGGLMKQSFGSKLDEAVMSPKGFATGIVGMAALPAMMATAGGGGAAAAGTGAKAASLVAPMLNAGANYLPSGTPNTQPNLPTQGYAGGGVVAGSPLSGGVSDPRMRTIGGVESQYQKGPTDATGTGTSTPQGVEGQGQSSTAGTGPAGVDSSQWDTNGYAKPGYVAPKPQGSAPPGWDGTKWNDPNHQSPKYVAGRIMSQYAPSVDNMDAMVAELQQAYPGTQRVGKGDISIPGVGTIDVLRKAGAGGDQWQWLTGDGGNGEAGAAGGGSGAGYDAQGDFSQSDLIAKILAGLGGWTGTGGKGVTSTRDALLAQLGT